MECVFKDVPPASDSGHLAAFRLELGLPVWRYEVDGIALEKRLLLTHLQNTTYATYRLVAGDSPLQLILRPLVHIRPHDAAGECPASRPVPAHGLGESL